MDLERGNRAQISPPPEQDRASETAPAVRVRLTPWLHRATIWRRMDSRVAQMVDLVRAGLTTAIAERVVVGSRTMQVARVRITEAGRRTLAKDPAGG
jgi:hypothetical protein